MTSDLHTMANHSPPATIEADYALMERALTETARGRWFLSEYQRRHRASETQLLIGMMERLERAVGRGHPGSERLDRMRLDLTEMKADLLRHHGAARRPEGGNVAEPVTGLGATIDRNAARIVDVAEDVQEAAWNLRDGGADPRLCEELDGAATEIYRLCAAQQNAARQVERDADLLRNLEARVSRMLREDGGEEAARPPLVGARSLAGEDLAFVLPAAAEPADARPATHPADPGILSLEDLDRLPDIEKLRLFT